MARLQKTGRQRQTMAKKKKKKRIERGIGKKEWEGIAETSDKE
jgi:hypothetical protein